VRQLVPRLTWTAAVKTKAVVDVLMFQQLVKPRCGRLIGFESSVYHGMTPIKSGRRCVLLISFTVNYNLRELAHLQAETLLRGLDSTR